jgi:hypothetical protein
MENQFSVIEYLYRDASNYKAWGELLIKGVFSETDINLLRSCLYDTEFFVPEEVSIPPLQYKLWDK